MEACDLLGHRFANGFLEFVHWILHIRWLLLIRVRFNKRVTCKNLNNPFCTLIHTHRVCEQQFLHTLEECVSAAGQERRQVCVHLGAQLASLFPTLQLNTGQRQRDGRHVNYKCRN